MEFSFSLKSLHKYIREIRATNPSEAFTYEGIVLFMDDTNLEDPKIGLCLYSIDQASNLDLLMPKKLPGAGKNSSQLFCQASFSSISRPDWDLVFFSKSDWERTLRHAKKLNGAGTITFNSANCFPQLGNGQDGILGVSNLILRTKTEVSSPALSWDYSFGKPFPPVYRDEALQIAFRLIEYKIVTNQWLINFIGKVDALQKRVHAFSGQQLLVSKQLKKSSTKRKTSLQTPRKTEQLRKASTLKKKIKNEEDTEVLTKNAPKSPLRLNSKPETGKKKGAKKKSKKHFKINNLGFTI